MTEIIRYDKPGNYSFTLYAGQYVVHCYGAKGGDTYDDNNISPDTGGKGAYARGTMVITGSGTFFYAFVGGKGESGAKGPNKGGFNGGGDSGMDTGGWPSNDDDAAGGGGGATDLRINDDSIGSRIIVAGGGSGGAWACKGAHGGQYKINCPISNDNYQETDGGNPDGRGGNGDNAQNQPGGGGGGGYYGGRGGEWCNKESSSHSAVGCGGSSYISGDDEHFIPNKFMKFKDPSIIIDHNNGDGLFIIEEDFKCSSHCSECISESICTKCLDNFFLYEGVCISDCPSTHFVQNQECIKCDKSCATCTETSTHCTSCNEGFYLHANDCISKCPTGSTGIESVCYECTSPCKTCSLTRENCLSCIDNYALYDNECFLNCPKKTFKTETTCEPCSPYCETCIDSPTFCTSCIENYFLYNNECLASCPEKMIGYKGVCVDCRAPCETCNEYDSCLTCLSGFYLYQNHCYEKCPEGSSPDGNECIQK
ncbi:hypothetical protein M9Y10_010575 [Tritrichomonas musculus]|uniref:receptor protein-tyrosine kinase n=1 Tax=Tritrichomonas musculus TaxID=1915356 RepID=A0ABR2IL73_9EUKA